MPHKVPGGFSFISNQSLELVRRGRANASKLWLTAIAAAPPYDGKRPGVRMMDFHHAGDSPYCCRILQRYAAHGPDAVACQQLNELQMSDLAYRYADANLFKVMLESQELWFTDLRRMNDWNEYAAGFRIACEIAEEVFPEFLDFLNKISPAQMRTDFMILICSFSTDGDCLSMWRGYGDNGAGAAIGYDHSEISTHQIYTRYQEKGGPFFGKPHFYPVIYSEGDFRLRARAFIEAALKESSTAAAYVHLSAMSIHLMRMCTLYKSDFFMDERELRGFIEVNKTVDPYEIGPRTTDFGPASHVRVKTLGFSGPAIKEVVLGPKCKLTVEDAKAMLLGCGLANVRVRQSRITYR